MISQLISEYWICDGQYEKVDSSKVPNELPTPFIYEVVRVKNGKTVFLEEHLKRLIRSIELAIGNYEYDKKIDLDNILKSDISAAVYLLIEQLNIINNNIRIAVWKNDDELSWRIYPIKSSYPDEKMYAEGVKVSSYLFERPDPEAKIYYNDMKTEVASICENTGVFEVLLTKDNGEWTEGSRSNLFFISDGRVYSAKREDILHGITRMKLLEVLELLDIPLVETDIYSKDKQRFEAAFLTGTSIHVLPIYSVDGYVYHSSDNELCQKIALKFEELINLEYGE